MISELKRARSLGNGKHLLCFAAMIGLFTVCGPSASDPADSTKVVVKDYKFTPTPLTVKVGSTVTWTNTDDEPHNATSDTGLSSSRIASAAAPLESNVMPSSSGMAA